MKRFLSTVLASVMVLTLAACGGGTGGQQAAQPQPPAKEPAATQGAAKTLTFGHAQSDSHLFHETALKFKELLEEKSGGQMSVDVFANGTLGDEREMAESLQMGTLDMCISAVATLSGFDSDLDVFNFPYLFEDSTHAYNVLMGDLGRELFKPLEDQGIKYLGQLDLGFRNMTNNKLPITAPADCQGIRMRTMQSTVCVEALSALGIDAVAMSFGELFTALQTSAVDGQENPVSVIYSSRFYEVQKYLSLTEHLYPVSPILIGAQTWNALSEEEQTWVADSMSEALEWSWAESAVQSEEMLQELADSGMAVNEVDKAPFIEATAAVYEKYDAQYGELIRQIKEAA